MCEIDAGDPLMAPTSAEGILIIKETQLFNYVVHDQIGVDGRLRSD